jgi:hypothetical protein
VQADSFTWRLDLYLLGVSTLYTKSLLTDTRLSIMPLLWAHNSLQSMMEKWFKCLFENKHYFSCFVFNNESFVFFFIYCFLCLFILVAKHLSCFFPSFKVYFEFKFFYLFYIFIRDRIWFCSCYQGVCTRNIKSCIFWSVFNYILCLFLHIVCGHRFQQC